MSGYVKQHLPIILVNHMTMEKNVQKTLSAGFVEVDRSLASSRIDCEFSGTTAVVSYLKVCAAQIGLHVEVDRSLASSRIDCEFSSTTAVVIYLKVCSACAVGNLVCVLI